jgi:hypothetical protein
VDRVVVLVGPLLLYLNADRFALICRELVDSSRAGEGVEHCSFRWQVVADDGEDRIRERRRMILLGCHHPAGFALCLRFVSLGTQFSKLRGVDHAIPVAATHPPSAR